MRIQASMQSLTLEQNLLLDVAAMIPSKMASVPVSSICLTAVITSEFFSAVGSMQFGTNMSGSTTHSGVDGLAASDQGSYFKNFYVIIKD